MINDCDEDINALLILVCTHLTVKNPLSSIFLRSGRAFFYYSHSIHLGIPWLAQRRLHADHGTAPSAELLATWNKREGELITTHGADAVPAVAFPPEPQGAYVGQDIPDDVRKKIYAEGARTIPGREHGGSCDVSCLECDIR